MRGVLLVLLVCVSASVCAPAVAAPATTTPPAPAPAPLPDPNAGLRELPPGSKTAPDTTQARSDTPALILLSAVLLLAALIAVVWGATRLTGAEPRWLAGLRHSYAEAGWRAAGTWTDFRDWLRPRA